MAYSCLIDYITPHLSRINVCPGLPERVYAILARNSAILRTKNRSPKCEPKIVTDMQLQTFKIGLPDFRNRQPDPNSISVDP
jgi:hypothetical protein